MDREQIINMEDKQLAVEVPRVFKELFPELWEHNLSHSYRNAQDEWWCIKCKETWRGERSNCSDICTVPDPIDVEDLAKAIEVYRSLKRIMNPEYVEICAPVYQKAGWDLFNDDLVLIYCIKEWVLEEATPQQIWQICLLAREPKQLKTIKN